MTTHERWMICRDDLALSVYSVLAGGLCLLVVLLSVGAWCLVRWFLRSQG